MPISNERLHEVLRRAEMLRARSIRRKKLALSLGCLALLMQLALLLKDRLSLATAFNAAFYGSLVFVGQGNHYVVIAVTFFLLGILAGRAIDALVRRWKKTQTDRYTQRWMGDEKTPQA